MWLYHNQQELFERAREWVFCGSVALRFTPVIRAALMASSKGAASVSEAGEFFFG